MDIADLREMCRLAGLDPNSSPAVLTGGYSNQNFLVEGPDGRFVLRVYREASLARHERMLHDLVASVAPVPELTYVEENASQAGRAFAVQRYVEGTLLDKIVSQGPEAASAGASVGETLARIGSVTFAGSGFLDHDLKPTGSPRADTGIVEYVGEQLSHPAATQALGAFTGERLLAVLRDHLALLEGIGPENALVHCDFNPKNLIMEPHDGGWRVAAVLDWEFAFAGSPLWDVANMMRHQDEFDPDFSKAFIKGYVSAGGELPNEWRRMGRLIDCVNLAQFVATGPGNPFYEFAVNRLQSIADSGLA